MMLRAIAALGLAGVMTLTPLVARPMMEIWLTEVRTTMPSWVMNMRSSTS